MHAMLNILSKNIIFFFILDGFENRLGDWVNKKDSRLAIALNETLKYRRLCSLGVHIMDQLWVAFHFTDEISVELIMWSTYAC